MEYPIPLISALWGCGKFFIVLLVRGGAEQVYLEPGGIPAPITPGVLDPLRLHFPYLHHALRLVPFLLGET